ncbi:MAG: sulfatase-like hydrolase/transferase [Gammaproteobacteria bacterium]|nr:sulfatase-like hydrolase/transferase [Gammaproteobacteria bacterium]
MLAPVAHINVMAPNGRVLGLLVLALTHLSVPLTACLAYGASPLWIMGTLVFLAALWRIGTVSSGVGTRVLCASLSLLSYLLSFSLAVSFYMQGVGYTEAFFFHLNIGTLPQALSSYQVPAILGFLGLILSTALPLVIPVVVVPRALRLLPLPIAFLAVFLSSAPLWSFVSYLLVANEIDVSNQYGLYVESDGGLHSSDKGLFSDDRKNIILIYAESLESIYLDTAIFPQDYLPKIKRLAADAHMFSNMQQIAGTGWTIGGMVASQCGFPLMASVHSTGNSTIASVEKPYPDSTCLGDILADRGYKSVFMGGADLAFAGKGNFLSAHGYHEVLGREQLASKLEDPDYLSLWGLYDDSLFALAGEKFKELEKSSQPYLLTLLTVDTHHPNGYPSRSCSQEFDDDMGNSLRCSDLLISEFIRHVRNNADMERTLIVLFSDHLSMRNSLWPVLNENHAARKLLFMLFDNHPGDISDIQGNHLNVAPTIIDAAGVATVRTHTGAHSLFDDRLDELTTEAVNEATPSLLMNTAAATEVGVTISRLGYEIELGDFKVKANKNGMPFKSGMYMLLLDDEAKVIDTMFSENYMDLAASVPDAFVVGISVLPDRQNFPSYFFGRITETGEKIRQGALKGSVFLSAQQIRAAM